MSILPGTTPLRQITKFGKFLFEIKKTFDSLKKI
jgi:hypothetical protein